MRDLGLEEDGMNHDLIALEDAAGLLFVPLRDLASLVPEFRGRWRGVLGNGDVVHRPSAPSCGRWLQRRWLEPLPDGRWRDPAGFVHEGPLSDPPPAADPEPGTEPVDVLWLRALPGRVSLWGTGQGEVQTEERAEVAALRHPGLIRIGARLWVQRDRVRRVSLTGPVVLEGGLELEAVQPAFRSGLATALGVDDLEHLRPFTAALVREKLREYPLELARAPAASLRSWFTSPRVLIANVIFQALRLAEAGALPSEYGKTHRGFWYVPLEATLNRAGFVTRPDRGYDDPLWLLYQDVIARLVGDDQLFGYADLGFQDDHVGGVGALHPEVVLLVEKESVLASARRVAELLGLSWLLTRGTPNLVDVEFFVQSLPLRRLRLIAFVDFDPAGWTLSDTAETQLRRYGCELLQPTEFVVRAECFSAEELELYALPCPTHTAALAARARWWLERGGGIDGQALGVHANHLQPWERVRDRVLQLL